MEYLEKFRSRFEDLYKTRDVPNTRESIVEKLLITRRTTRAQHLTELRNIPEDSLSPSPVLMVSAGKQQKGPQKKMSRLDKLKLWKAEKLKKTEEQKAKKKPFFNVGAKPNVGFPNINDNKQIVKKSFAPCNYVFKAPVNVKAIQLIAVTKALDPFKRVTRSQKAHASPPPSLPVRARKKVTDSKKNEKTEPKMKSKLSRQNAFDDILQETTNKVNEQNAQKSVRGNNTVKKGNKENIFLNVDDRSNKNSEKPENKLNEAAKKATSSKRKSMQKSISNAEKNTKETTSNSNKKQLRKSFKKSTSNANIESDLNGTNPEITPIEDAVFSPVVTNTKSKRRSFRLDTENNEEPEDKLNETASIRKSMQRKTFKRSTTNANNEIDLDGTYEFTNPEITPIKDAVFSPVATYAKSKRRSLRLNVENNEIPQKSTLNGETSKRSTSSKRKSMQKSNSEAEDNTKKETSNKRQSRRKSFRKSTSTTDKESDLNSTYELINPEDQLTPVKDDVFSPVAAYISPFVTTSRGKGSLKKENKERSNRGLPSFTEFITVDEKANSSFQVTGASYFHTSLNNEIARLTLMCKTWNTYKENTSNLPEDANDLIDVAVGQANLLMNKKFQQFRKLIVSCENGYGEDKPVTCEDLQGFWDMIYIQVENLNARFNRLTELKNQHWQDIIPVVQQKVAKKVGNKKRIKSAATSSIRAAIEAARKKTKSTSSIDDTVFNGGFFIVKSPQKKTHTPETTKTPVKDRRSLLKSVLSSETRKSSRKSAGSPGINMMKASQTAKSVENLNFTLPTPGKSILKKTVNKKSITHTSKAVLFKESDSE